MKYRRPPLWTLVAIAGAALAFTGCPEDDPKIFPDIFIQPDLPNTDVGSDAVVVPDPGQDDAGIQCTNNEDCPDPGLCKVALCQGGQCTVGNQVDGSPCDDGDPCTEDTTCTGGSCGGGLAVNLCGEWECGTDECGNACGDFAGDCPPNHTCDATTGVCNPDVGPGECGDVTYEGCCLADGTGMKWCDTESQQVVEEECAEGELCSWVGGEYNFYYCVPPPAYPGPAQFPYMCEGESCDTVECGVGCGACENEGDGCLDGVCTPCDPPCGDDEFCLEETLICIKKDACSFTTYEGCCDGLVTYWCEDGQSAFNICGDSCGWIASQGYYYCGGEGEDPSGTYPLECFDEVPVEPGPEPGPEPAPEPAVEPEPDIVVTPDVPPDPGTDPGPPDPGTDPGQPDPGTDPGPPDPGTDPGTDPGPAGD